MFSYTKKKQKDGRASNSERSASPERRTMGMVLASYAANAGRLRRRILRILSPARRAQDSV